MSKAALKHFSVVGFFSMATLALSLGVAHSERVSAQEGQSAAPAATATPAAAPKKKRKSSKTRSAPSEATSTAAPEAAAATAATTEAPKKAKKKKAASQAPSAAAAAAPAVTSANKPSEGAPASQTETQSPAAADAATTTPPAEPAAPAAAKESDAGASQAVRPGETLMFKTDYAEPPPAGGEFRQPLKFTTEPSGGVKASSASDAPGFEDAGFKVYVGYPKHQVGLNVAPQTLSAKWNYNGQDYNFSSSSLGYGVWYKLQATPLIHLAADWNRFTSGVTAGTFAGGTFQTLESDETYDVFSVSGRYCIVSATTFFHRFCPGLRVTKDSYPILDFIAGSGVILQMSKVEDITVGVTFDYDYPMSEKFLLKARAGYSYGTGLGNSGVLTSKSNSAIQVQLGTSWAVSDTHEISVMADYVMRMAELKGNVGGTKDKWETSSGNISGVIGYGYTF